MPVETRRRKRQACTATDHGMLVLIKLVMADDWSAVTAARQLARKIRDPRVLARMSARVGTAQSERPSEFGRRAELTLSYARSHLHAA